MTVVEPLLRGSAAATAGPDVLVEAGQGPDQGMSNGRAGGDGPDRRPGAWASSPAVVLPIVAAVLAAVLAVALVQAEGDRGPGPGEAIVTLRGRAFVARADGTSEAIKTGDDVRLRPGDRIDVRRGLVDMQLAGGVAYQALAGAGRTPDASIAMARTPTLRAGRLLVRSPRQPAPLHAGIADVTVREGGVARIVRSYAVTVGSYRGTTVLDSAGAKAAVPALRSQQAAAAGELGRRRPLDIVGDPWDRIYLADAMTLDHRLGPIAQGMRAAKVLPDELLESVRISLRRVPGRSEVARMVADRPSRLDLGIGLAVVGNGRGGSLTDRWERGTRFHDDGATWGLVAMDADADPASVVDDLTTALGGDVLPPAGGGFAGLGDLSAATAGSDLLGADGPTGSGDAGGPGSAGGPGEGGSTGGPNDPGSTGGGTEVTVPTVTTPGGVTVPTTPGGVTVPTTPITTPTVPNVTTPAVPAVPVVPGVTTPPISPVTVPDIGTVVSTVGGVVSTLLPPLGTTTTRPPTSATTTTTKPPVVCVLGICI